MSKPKPVGSRRIWPYLIPLVVLFVGVFLVVEAGVQGRLHSGLLRERVFPSARSLNGWFTDQKFRLRGVVQPKNKIVVVEIDGDAIAAKGRWPWHRDLVAFLLQEILNAGAKVVGLDIVFSEPDRRVSIETQELLAKQGLSARAKSLETDPILAQLIAEAPERIVLGWLTENSCQTLYLKPEDCPVNDPGLKAQLPKDFDRFSFSSFSDPSKAYRRESTALLSAPEVTVNLPEYNRVARHSGHFNVQNDADGTIRSANLALFVDGVPYPSLALEMARTGLNESLGLKIDSKTGYIEKIEFTKSHRRVPVSPLGLMEVNYRGPSQTFQYVRALQVMDGGDTIQIERDRKIVSASKSELFKDAYVLVGLSAIGVFDMRAFPFDAVAPGVDGHAQVLDNLLAGDMMTRGSTLHFWILIFLLSAGALGMSYLYEKLSSIPALGVAIGFALVFWWVDQKLLFANLVNWNSGLVYIEYALIFMIVFALKYVMEEKNKKFIRGALSKYVSPSIIESILNDPTKLSLGGERRELSIMFSDIRSFTTMSEKMDPKILSQFLNEYLGQMTDLVFANQGTLDKYIGDAVMAFWGAPLIQPEHATNSCLTAVAMIQALERLQAGFKATYGVDVNVGIGLNSGVVSVGNMGSERIFEYTVIGDHVNLASRIEGLTKEYGVPILATSFTRELCKGEGAKQLKFRTLDHVKVKGKKQAVEILQLLHREYPEDGLLGFEEGRKLYQAQAWDEALSVLERAQAKFRESFGVEDEPTRVLIERCHDFKRQPPESGWDGSWQMHSK